MEREKQKQKDRKKEIERCKDKRIVDERMSKGDVSKEQGLRESGGR